MRESTAVIISTQKKETIYRISVPVHKKNALKIGLLKSLMKLASISEEELISMAGIAKLSVISYQCQDELCFPESVVI